MEKQKNEYGRIVLTIYTTISMFILWFLAMFDAMILLLHNAARNNNGLVFLITSNVLDLLLVPTLVIIIILEVIYLIMAFIVKYNAKEEKVVVNEQRRKITKNIRQKEQNSGNKGRVHTKENGHRQRKDKKSTK